MAYIGLLDCNNFFVSCERLFKPDLAQKPVVILSSNDGCVISRSNEAKALGIPMGIPHFKVRDELKTHDITVFSGNIVLYRDISSRVMSALASFGTPFEPYSIDEAFFTLEEGKVTDGYIHEIRDRVMRWTGIPVSIGVGKSAVIAKYASGRAKKGVGVHIIHSDESWQEEMKTIQVGELWGVGRSTTATCLKNDIKTAHDIAHQDTARLKAVLGIEGARLKDALLGRYAAPIETKEDQKSIMSSRSFSETTSSKEVLFDALTYHIEHAAEKMRKHGHGALRMSVHIRPRRHGNYAFRGGYDEVLFMMPVSDTRELLRHAKNSLERLYEADIPYGKAGVVLSGFVPVDASTQSLFDDGTKANDNSKLMSLVDSLNGRLGKAGIHFGRTAQHNLWKTSSQYRSLPYTTDWQHIPVVQTAKDKNKGHMTDTTF